MKQEARLFSWQDGYAGISVSPSQVGTVKKYIATQGQHHRKRTFDEELLGLLDKAGVPYDKRYVLAG